MLIDTHCHLDAPEFAADRDAVFARARAAGVVRIVLPAVAARTFADTLLMREQYGCDLAFGLHPIYLGEHRPAHLALLRQHLESHRPVAVGEIGLDGFIDGADLNTQEVLLLEQLRIARDFDLPVLLHIRHAQDRVLKCLRQTGVKNGIAHAFNGSQQQAEAFIRQGFKLGFGGAMTWPRALNIRRLAASLPLDTIVLETDAPDIPPEWLGQRGRNEPAELPRMARILADLRGISPEEIICATGHNARTALRLS
jgi:TatD DNase family protein